jgi:cell division protein FtsL
MSARLRKSRVVKERDPRSVRLLGIAFGACSAGAALLLFPLWTRVEITAMRYRLTELRAERDALVEQHKALRLERSALRTLPRVERLARERLGLQPARPDQVFTLGESGSLASAPPSGRRNRI